MNIGTPTSTSAIIGKTKNEASSHSQSKKSLRKLVKSARYAMEKRDGSNHKETSSNKPYNNIANATPKPARGGGRFQRSVDHVVPPPPSGGVTLSSSLHSTPRLGMAEAAQRLKEEQNHNSLSSISNVSSVGVPGLKVNHNNMYNSLSSISNVSSVKPRKSDGRALKAFNTATEDSLSSIHDFQNDSFNSSVSDLTASQDLNVSRNSFSNSLASLNAAGAQGPWAEHLRKQLGSSIDRLKVTPSTGPEPLSKFAGSSHHEDSDSCYPSTDDVTENVHRRSLGSLDGSRVSSRILARTNNVTTVTMS